MNTTIPQPPPLPTPVVANAPRCDRCGARAVAVTHPLAADLGWCRHHLREHAASLEAAGIEVALLRGVA
jgi:ribosomal protein S14